MSCPIAHASRPGSLSPSPPLQAPRFILNSDDFVVNNNNFGPLRRGSVDDCTASSMSLDTDGMTAQRGPVSDDAVDTWRNALDENIRKIFANLRTDMEHMERNVKIAENEVFRKEEEAFIQRQDELEVACIIKRHAQELQGMKEVQERLIEERKQRRLAKKVQREVTREAKSRHIRLRQQMAIQRTADHAKVSLAEHRVAFDASLQHLERKQARQYKQLEEAQERYLRDERSMIELETRQLRPELREEVMRDFGYRMNNQAVVVYVVSQEQDKKRTDQLREVHQLEIKQRKERFDAENNAIEERTHLLLNQVFKVDELELIQRKALAVEKDRIDEAKSTVKSMSLVAQHNAELKRLMQHQKVHLRQQHKIHKARMQLKRKKWHETMTHLLQGHEESNSQILNGHSLSAPHSPATMTRTGSDASIAESDMGRRAGMCVNSDMLTAQREATAEAAEIDAQLARLLNEEKSLSQRNIDKLNEELAQKIKQHQEDQQRMKKEHELALRALDDSIQASLGELDLQHETEMRSLMRTHEAELAEIVAVQKREAQLEANIRANERSMMVERRTLSSILDTVVDGVINIDTNGHIKRFNAAAEGIFGWTSAEVLNKNVSLLMPAEFGTNHDQYILNYLTTGVKKVLGKGKRVRGMKKDGTEFPIWLSVSEVREEDLHMFTGIVRDLTVQAAAEEAARAESARKQHEMEALIHQLNDERNKSASLVQQILPERIATMLLTEGFVPPTTYDNATILYTDICGFTEICSGSSPFDIIAMLNELYSKFDNIICKYDAYKVETIGDSYMCASGIPTPNGDAHYGEIATLALHLLKAITTVRIQHRPDVQLRMRLGIHSGPAVAGVVGRKMPRYCLFGDTALHASKMESTGTPMKIQISEQTYLGLQRLGGFRCEARGSDNARRNHVPGKTYYLLSKDGFDPVVDGNSASQSASGDHSDDESDGANKGSEGASNALRTSLLGATSRPQTLNVPRVVVGKGGTGSIVQ
ncbi:hypothetical protein RI367_005126 [Sorochytrium milnesiophthora]